MGATGNGVPLCVAFSNTLGRDDDDLGSPAALATWLAGRGDAGVGDDVLLRVGQFRALRDAVRDAFVATAERRAIPRAAIEALNGTSAMAPSWPVLVADGAPTAVLGTEIADTSETARILASVARSTIELIGGPDATRLGGCRACGRFFLRSRGPQVWCSASCGNRTRVARHRARRAASARS
jgi:predicted RNA-binding Zn ribbon-like protein